MFKSRSRYATPLSRTESISRALNRARKVQSVTFHGQRVPGGTCLATNRGFLRRLCFPKVDNVDRFDILFQAVGNFVPRTR